MEDLEDKLLGILNNPQMMEQVMATAKSLGLSEEGSPPSELLQKVGGDGRQEALIRALEPYLKPNRRKKLERAMRLAQLSHLAGFALQSDGGEHNV